MRKHQLFLATAAFLITGISALLNPLRAQVSAYSFAQSSGTYSSIFSTGTAVAGTAGGWDDDNGNITIPFTFTINGVGYTSCNLNTNGFITFGGSISDPATYTPISSTESYAAAIAPFGRDLICSATNSDRPKYQSTGSAPNRVFVIEWYKARRYNAGPVTGDNLNFQIRLAEGTNVIQVIYGGCAATNATTLTCQVGLRGSSNADFNNRSVGPSWASSVAGTTNTATCASSNTILPASGLTFTWTPPSCAAPGISAATNVTSASATLNWSAASPAPSGGYQWEVRTAGAGGSGNTGLIVYGNTAAGVLTAGTASGTFVTGTQLSPNTTYSIYVRSNCGSGTFSAWGGPLAFTTPCANTGLPVSQGFNAATIPSCWTQQFITGTSAIQYVTSSSFPTTTPQEGSHYVLWNSFSYANNQETRLVSPPITTTGTSSVDVSFYWMNENEPDYSTGAYLNEGVTVQYSLNGTTWTNVQLVPRHDATLTAYTNQWKQKTITLPAAAGNKPTVYVGLKFHSSYGDNCALDNLMISATPSCLPPVVTAPTAVTSTSATLHWNASTSTPSGGYEWEVRTSGAGGSGAAGLATNGSTAAGVLMAATGNVLTANTPYSIYVRSDCGSGSFSLWSAAYTFTTPCNAATLPYTQNFDGVTPPAIPSCSVVQDANADGVTWATVDDSFMPGHSSPNSLAYEYNFDGTTAANDWWFTQGLNLTAGTAYQISFKYSSASSFYTEGVAVKAGTAPSAAGMTGAVLYSNTAITNESYQNAIFYYTPGTDGVYYFGWHAISAADQLQLLIDDISVKVATAPSCLAGPSLPANGGTLCQSAGGSTLRWPASSDASGYDVYLDMGSAATTLVSSNQADTFYTTPAQLAAGGYAWRVVPRNPVGSATGCATWTFTVEPAPAITITPSAAAICPPATSLNLAADGALSYNWSPAYGLSSTTMATVTASPLKSTSYTVTGTGSNGCKTSVNVPVSVGPVINAPISATPATLCVGSTSQLLVSPGATAQTYSMAAVSPSFYDMTGGTTITTWTDGTDDGFYAATIPFSFRFFGNSYTTLRISTNGYMTFNGAGQAEEFVPQAMPDATTPNNLIAAVWTDLEQVGTALTRTKTVGTTPNRVFIVDYSNVPTLDGDSTISAQVQLYEKTNRIEIHVAHAGVSNTSDGASIGIEGTATGGIKGFAPGGRSLFTTNITSPEAYRFTPDTVLYAWTPAASLSNPAIKNPVATPPAGATVYTATLTEPGTGCTLAPTVTVTANPNGYWLGATSNDWTTATNWCGGVPTATSDVIIPNAVSVLNSPAILFATTGSAHNIQLNDGSVLTVDGGGTLALYGDVSLGGAATFDAAAGSVNFAGSAAQTIMPDFSVTNMQIGGGGTKTLAGNVTINGELNFQDGMLDVGASILTMANNATIGNAGETRYVRTSAGGSLRRTVSALPVTFPVGNAAYNPATLVNNGAPDGFSVGVRDEVQQEGNSGTQIDNTTTYAVDHTWDISEDVAGGSDVTLTLQWNSGEENSPGFDINHVYISHYSGTSWDNPYPYAFLAPAAGGSGPFTATRSGITSFSPFAVGSAGGSSPLPVTLVRLSATNAGSRNKVEWESATEHDLASYIVERSTDGKSFARMDEVTAAGKAQGYITYDNQPNAGLTYYRLKMIDYSGAFVYSQTVQAFMGRSGEVVVTAQPNPLRDVLTVSVYGAQDGQAQLTDVSGRVVAGAAVQGGTATFNTSALAAGTYFVKWSNGAAAQTIKVTKQ